MRRGRHGASGGRNLQPLKYLVKPEPPVEIAPSLSGSVTGIIAPSTEVDNERKLTSGDVIIGVTSSGLHSNGVSLVIKQALALPDKFLTKLGNGAMLGEEALIPTRSYILRLSKRSLEAARATYTRCCQGTGDGVAKNYRIRQPSVRINTASTDWPKVPELFQVHARDRIVAQRIVSKTFNWELAIMHFVTSKAEADKHTEDREVGGI